MMEDFNQLILTAKLTTSPNLEYVAARPVCRFTLEIRGKPGTPGYEDLGIMAKCEGRLAEFVAQQLSMGSRVLVSGRLQCSPGYWIELQRVTLLEKENPDD